MVETKSNLNLRRVVLFKCGIGSFQKMGSIDLSREKSIKVNFKDTVINDLLKTFSILKIKGDLKVSGVSYEAKETDKTKLLQDSDINLPQSNSFTALFSQLRGIAVRVYSFNIQYDGKVLGIQRFTEANKGEAILNKETLLLVLNDDFKTITSIKVDEITGLEILNNKIQKDFNFFLEIITSQNKQKKKAVTIFFEGEQESEYLLNFLQVTPSWKTTYRIFLEEGEKEQEKEKEGDNIHQKSHIKSKIKLQAWAIIDNVLDEDWENVDLTLVSGLPVSFIYDSYSPAWKVRPIVERETELGVKIVQFDTRSEMMAEPDRLKKKMRGAEVMYDANQSSNIPLKPPSMPPAGPPGGAAPPPPAKPLALRGSIMGELKQLFSERDGGGSGVPVATSSEMIPKAQRASEKNIAAYKDTFKSDTKVKGGKGLAMKYHITHPVYVKRNNSSLIPLLEEEVEGKLISIYNKGINEKNPIETLIFTNKDFALEKGPISVFINNIFSGEAMLSYLDKGSEGRVSFAVDQEIVIRYDVKNEKNYYHKISIGEEIYKKFYRTKRTIYKIENISEGEKELEIEHLKTYLYELYESPEPDKENKVDFVFKMKIKPKSKMKFIIQERKLDKEYISTSNVTSVNLSDWLGSGLIKESEHSFLEKLINLFKQKNSLYKKTEKLHKKIQDIHSEQYRIRENISSLKNGEAENRLRQTYINKLDTQEDDLENIAKELISLEKKLQNNKKETDDHLNLYLKSTKDKEN